MRYGLPSCMVWEEERKRPRAIIPDTRPLGTFDKQDSSMMVRRSISKRSREKIGDCEQSIIFSFSYTLTSLYTFSTLRKR